MAPRQPDGTARERTRNKVCVSAAHKAIFLGMEGKVQVSVVVVYGAAAALPSHERDPLCTHGARVEFAPCILVSANDHAWRVDIQNTLWRLGRAEQRVF